VAGRPYLGALAAVPARIDAARARDGSHPPETPVPAPEAGLAARRSRSRKFRRVVGRRRDACPWTKFGCLIDWRAGACFQREAAFALSASLFAD
jgi:hypothetical protein